MSMLLLSCATGESGVRAWSHRATRRDATAVGSCATTAEQDKRVWRHCEAAGAGHVNAVVELRDWRVGRASMEPSSHPPRCHRSRQLCMGCASVGQCEALHCCVSHARLSEVCKRVESPMGPTA